MKIPEINWTIKKGWKILIFFNKDWFDFGKLRHIEWSKQLGRYKIQS